MNRTQLDALLTLGLISLEQHQAALATMNSAGHITERPQLQLQAPASVSLSVDDKGEWDGILTGTVTKYGVLIPSHGLILEPGCLQARTPLSSSKLMRDHDHGQPVGYMLSVDDDGVEATYQVASTERARVLQEVNDKLRDGLSVGFTTLEYEIDDDWIFHVIKADWYETSLCALPAAAGAGVTSVAAALATLRKENRTMNRAQLAAALAAGTITQEQHDTALAALDAIDLATPPTPPAPEVATGPELQTTQPAPHVQVNERLSFAAVARRLAEAHDNVGASVDPMAAVRMAIADVIPADDAGAAFVNREDWVGEVWRATDDSRPWIDAIGAPEQMTKLKGKGWRWGIDVLDEDDEVIGEEPGTPEVDEYAGNKTEVPSNPIGTKEVTFDSFRIAGGWDVDRAFTDFSDEEFWSAFFEAAIRDYKKKSNIGIRTRLLAVATDTPTADVVFGTVGISGVLKQLRRDIRSTAGGHANRIFLGDTLFDAIEDLKVDDMPLWLRNATIGLGPEEGSADVGSLHIVNDPALGTKDSVVFDNRGLKVKERSPFWVKAENIPKGGIDVGVFSYLRLEPHDPRLVIKRTYA